jgi:hypothetical protein
VTVRSTLRRWAVGLLAASTACFGVALASIVGDDLAVNEPALISGGLFVLAMGLLCFVLDRMP